LTFKKGAFFALKPVKIICVKFDTENGIWPHECDMGILDVRIL